jgi:hypothetical protein
MVNGSIIAEKQRLSPAAPLENSNLQLPAVPKLNGIMAVAVTASKLRANSRDAGRCLPIGTAGRR